VRGMTLLSRRRFIGLTMAVSALALRQRWSLAATDTGTGADGASYIRRAGLTFRPRSHWTSEPSRHDRLRQMENFDRVTIHHSGGDQFRESSEVACVQRLQGMLAEHVRRGYGDIGYHFVVDPAGRVWEGRSLVFEGAHVISQNDANIGVVALGDYDRQELAEAQKGSISLLIGCLRERFGIKLHRVYGHSDLGASACPGRNLYAWVNELKG